MSESSLAKPGNYSDLSLHYFQFEIYQLLPFQRAVLIFYVLSMQIVGPFSFRVDSGVSLDLKNNEWHVSVDDPVFAIEFALQVVGSAKAVAWCSPKQKEFMIELRFFET